MHHVLMTQENFLPMKTLVRKPDSTREITIQPPDPYLNFLYKWRFHNFLENNYKHYA